MSAGRKTIALNLLDFDKPELAIKHFVVIIVSRVGVNICSNFAGQTFFTPFT